MDLEQRRVEVEAMREEKDRYFQRAANSPLPREDRGAFGGLAYYPYDEDLVFRVELEEVDDPAEVVMATSVEGRQAAYRRVGFFEFEVAGTPRRLYAYRQAHGHGQPSLFVPFRDGTSGEATYGAGRYLDLEVDPSGEYVLDFNEAYNPYCAYSEDYVCPLPPRENWLDVPIEAGEKAYPLAD